MTETAKELTKKLNRARNEIHAGSTWKHYKGGIYSIKGTAISTIDGEVCIKYNKIASDETELHTALLESEIEYVRPYREWFEDVEQDPGVFIPRFRRCKQVKRWEVEDERS
jgi:hypothetical protein